MVLFSFFFFVGLERKRVYCDYLLISDVIVEHEIKWTKNSHICLAFFCLGHTGGLTALLLLIVLHGV